MRYNCPPENMKNYVKYSQMKRTIFFIFFMCAANYLNAQYSTWKPTVFKGTTYQPQQPNTAILQRSLEQIEQRERAANNQYEKLLTQLAEYGRQLNNDRETLIWFDQYKKKIQSNFYSYLNNLSSSEALNYAIRTQGEIAYDPELQARIRTADEYRSLVRSIEARTDLSWQEKQEWIQSHPYRFEAITNDEGKVIGGRPGNINNTND